MNIDNFWVYCKCKCMFVHCINVHISPYMPRSPGYSDEIGLTVTNAALTCPDQADNRLYESWCVCVWTVGSLVHSTEEYMVSYMEEYMCIYILWIIISYHIHFNSNFLFQGPGLCDFGISDMTWHLQTWKNSGCDGRKIPRHVVLPKFAGLVHEENIPRGRRSQWMNSKLGTHQNKIYKIEVPGVP